MKYNLSYFSSADGIEIPVYEFIPNIPIVSSIVLLYEIFGVTEHIKELSHKLSEKGFLVNVPDIFSRLEKNVSLPYNEKGFNKGIKIKEKLGWDLPIMDIVSCASLLKKKYKVSVMGFCFGGSLAWKSVQKSFIFDNAICYYGSSIPDFLNNNLNCPTIVHFGKNDKAIPADSVEKVKQFSKKQNNPVKIFEYSNADHGFNCEERKSYHAESAKLAMDRNFTFLKEL